MQIAVFLRHKPTVFYSGFPNDQGQPTREKQKKQDVSQNDVDH